MFGNHFLNFIKVIKYRDIVDNRDNCTVNIEILFSTLSHTPTSNDACIIDRRWCTVLSTLVLISIGRVILTCFHVASQSV